MALNRKKDTFVLVSVVNKIENGWNDGDGGFTWNVPDKEYMYRGMLSEVNLPNEATRIIGTKSFKFCTGIDTISIPHVEEIKGSAFYGCSDI